MDGLELIIENKIHIPHYDDAVVLCNLRFLEKHGKY